MTDTFSGVPAQPAVHSSPQPLPSVSTPSVEANAAPAARLPRQRPPLEALTGVRFFAASYVIVLHSRLGEMLLGRGFHLAGTFVENGYLAVTLFFLLSGFILSYNYCGKIETRTHVFRFWEARFARIWPAYLFSLFCSSFPLSHIPRFSLALATVLMVQSWNPLHPEYCSVWNFVCWSLSVEAFFYLVFPYLQTLLERLPAKQLALAGIFIALLCAVFNTPYHNMGARYPGIFYLIPAPLIHLPTFIAGVILGNLLLRRSGLRTGITPTNRTQSIEGNPSVRTLSKPPHGFAYFTWTGVLVSLVILCTGAHNWEGLSIASFSAVLYGLATEQTLLSKFLSTRLLILGGEISYALYLLRPPVQYWIIAYPALHNNRLIDLLYVPLLVVPLSAFCFFCIENPTRRALRRLFAVFQGS